LRKIVAKVKVQAELVFLTFSCYLFSILVHAFGFGQCFPSSFVACNSLNKWLKNIGKGAGFLAMLALLSG
jgi:hypothetical protein